jgi:GLPGLI family protein
MYHVLPKEMLVTFKDNKMELKIKKASMENTIIINSDDETMASYYSYGDVLTCLMKENEKQSLLKKQPNYKITFLKEKDTLLGFNVKKAIAIDPDRPYETIHIWYTDEIKLKKPNWFNGFEKIPGFMLKYDVIQYGIKMEFVAKKFNRDVEINDSILELKRPGKAINYHQFDSLIVNLFKSFQ